MGFVSYPKAFFAALTPAWIAAITAAAVVLFAAALGWTRKRAGSAGRAAAFAGLAAYLLVVFASTVFARKPGSVYRYSLRLFWSYREIVVHGKTTLLWENFWNVLLLLPYGLLLPCINPRGMAKKPNAARITILSGLMCSLSIELLQLTLKRGLFEFDDMVHNTIGVAIGYLLYRLLDKSRNKSTDANEVGL